MDEVTKNSIKLEQAEFVSRLMIDTEMTEQDIKIGLCLINYLLQKMQKQEKTKTG